MEIPAANQNGIYLQKKIIDMTESSNKPKSLWNTGFIALLVTQFTVAFNDNAFRWLLIPIGKAYVDGDFIRTLGSVFLVIPFLIWTSIAGFVTDRFSRRSVMIWCKLIELILLALAVGAILMGPAVGDSPASAGFAMPLKVVILLAILFLLGSQSTFFSPSKYSTIPDLVPDDQLSAANGIVSMLTMAACVLGQVVGGFVFAWTTLFVDRTNAEGAVDHLPTGIPGGEQIWITALVLLGVAAVGLISSFFIPKFKPVDINAKFPRNPFMQTGRDLAALFANRRLFWVSVASGFFWGLASLAVLNIDKFAIDHLRVQQQYVTILAAILSIGIAIGAVACGYLSGRKIELGLVPIGAFGIGFFLILLGFTPGYGRPVGLGGASPWELPYVFALVVMFLIGIMAGLYDIPLSAYIQRFSPTEQRGRMIAAYNFISFSMMLLFSIAFMGGAKLFDLMSGFYPPSLAIWIATGLMTLAVSIALICWLKPFFWISIITIPIRLLYRPKVIGLENLPEQGGALLASNHISLLDGLILYAVLPRNIRYFAHEAFVPKFLECVARETGLIKVLPGKKVVLALKTARQALKDGDLVGVFPEGGITRNGQMRAFEPGFLSILKGAEKDGKPIPIVPVHLHGLYESMFGYKYGDKKIKLRPRKLPNDVIISFGKPIYNPEYPMQVQRAVQELGVDSYREHGTKRLPAPCRTLIKTCRQRGRKRMFADTTGRDLSGYRFLTAILVLRKLLKKHVLGPRKNEPHVGVLAPMSVGGCLLNAAIAMDRRVPVDLNFTFGKDGINQCVKQAGIKHIMTSREILKRYPDLKELDAEIFCTEDVLAKAGFWTKIDCLLDATILPRCLLEWMLGLRARGINEELSTLIYTSGSTGRPKGVMLTNDNLAEVGRSFVDAMRLDENDTVLGFLPFFHAFGFMGNYWLPIFCGGAGVFHFSPLEPKKVGEWARKNPVTFIASTPTFLRNFLRRCPKEDFEHANTVMCGAEKVPIDLMDAWEEKYGVRPGEGFGATELSPLPTTNVPDNRTIDKYNIYRKDGSIGRAVANVAVKITDLETGEDLPPNDIGMIVVKGPIVMKGYYKQPELSAEVINDGWYTTGDVGKIDEDGFVWITGRQTRISKIGGEMVPHVLIEEEIQKVIAKTYADQGISEESVAGSGPILAVTAVPHETKGEQIVVLHQELPISPKEIIDAMIAGNVPKIWIPHLDGFKAVDSIPVLGTGKLDLAALKRQATELFG